MDDRSIALLILAIFGFYISRLWLRLAPWRNELPSKAFLPVALPWWWLSLLSNFRLR
ncbi:MAG: hypothetical protein R2865_13410 [Deinococcales bacterium]